MQPSTIIVVHRPRRRQGHLSACLAAISAFSDPQNKLIVVDAAGARDWIDETGLPGNGITAALQTVKAGDGNSLVKACNTVLEDCRNDQVVILDSAAIVSNRWLDHLGCCLETAPRAGMIGPLTERHLAGLSASIFGPGASAAVGMGDDAASRELTRYRRIEARTPDVLCMVFHLRTGRELGFLDDTLDDIDCALEDLCRRAELAGYQNYLAGDTFIKRSPGVPAYYNRKALRDKWGSLDPESDLRKHYEALNLYHRAEQARQRDETDRAVSLFLKGIGLCPAENRLYLGLAAMLTDAGQHSDALQTLQEIPDQSDSPVGLLITGICQRKMGQADEARATVDRLLATVGQSAAGWWLKGSLLADRGESNRAETAFQKGIQFDPGFGPNYTDLGHIERKRGQGEKGLNLLERGFTLAPTFTEPATAYHTAISQLQAYPRAIPIFSNATAACRSSRRLRYLLSDLLLKAGEQVLAMEVIESLLADFGLEEGLLAAALAVRARIGPHEVDKMVPAGATIGFCLIVRDEEQDLSRCLGSIKPVADEIIVVDTGSQDRTREIARVFGARVFEFEWCDDFAAAKNFAVGKADAHWIFSIDADEVLSPLDHDALLTLVQSETSGSVAYAVTTRNYLKLMDVVGWQPNDGFYPEEDGLGWIPSEKVRLFPNDRRVHFTYPVHEMVEPSLEKAGIQVVPCDIPIHHYGKLDQARSLTKGEAYFKIGIKKLEAMQTSATGIRELAIQAQTLGDYQEAVRLWERLLKLEPGQAHTYINLGTAHLELGQYVKALEMAGKACGLDPTIKEAHFNCAMSMLYTGDARGAAGILDELAERYPEYIAARFMLAAACCCAGDGLRAIEIMDKLRRTSLGEGMSEALRHLATGLEKAGQDRYRRRILEIAG